GPADLPPDLHGQLEFAGQGHVDRGDRAAAVEHEPALRAAVDADAEEDLVAVQLEGDALRGAALQETVGRRCVAACEGWRDGDQGEGNYVAREGAHGRPPRWGSRGRCPMPNETLLEAAAVISHDTRPPNEACVCGVS